MGHAGYTAWYRMGFGGSALSAALSAALGWLGLPFWSGFHLCLAIVWLVIMAAHKFARDA